MLVFRRDIGSERTCGFHARSDPASGSCGWETARNGETVATSWPAVHSGSNAWVKDCLVLARCPRACPKAGCRAMFRVLCGYASTRTESRVAGNCCRCTVPLRGISRPFGAVPAYTTMSSGEGGRGKGDGDEGRRSPTGADFPRDVAGGLLRRPGFDGTGSSLGPGESSAD